jgi:hypothetical protein
MNDALLIKPTLIWTRRVLYLSGVLVISVGLSLYLLSESTETFFSWTIQVPLTAAFLGSGYLSSFLLEFLAAREPVWARSRVAMPAVLVFTILTLFATLIHLDKFHFNASQLLTAAGTWVWLLIYAIVPVMQIVQIMQQARASGTDPAHHAPLPIWMRVLLIAQAVIMLLIGVIGTFAPNALMSIWVWQLTPLTARAMGAWFVGVGIVAAHANYENDLSRVRSMMVSYAAFGVLVLIALVRYPTSTGLDWANAGVWIYIGFMMSVSLVGTVGLLMIRRLRPDQLV